jgi:hypothetical protein
MAEVAIIAEARRLKADGLGYRSIAATLGATRHQVRHWLNGDSAPLTPRAAMSAAVGSRRLGSFSHVFDSSGFTTAHVGFDGCFFKIHTRGFAMERDWAARRKPRQSKIEFQAIIGCKPSKLT